MRLTFSIIGFALLTSGCVAPNPSDEIPYQEIEIASGIHVPIVVTDTSTEEAIFHINWLDDCPYTEYEQRFNYVIFDRHGQVDHVVGLLAYEETERIPIRLVGTSPFVIAWTPAACMRIAAILEGNIEAHQEEFDDEMWHSNWATVELNVPFGESLAEVTWTPPDFTYRIFQSGPGSRGGDGLGNISLWDPEGRVLRWDEFDRGRDIGGELAIYMPGAYTIRLELERPAIIPTTWEYRINYFALSEGFCVWDFEWEICPPEESHHTGGKA